MEVQGGLPSGVLLIMKMPEKTGKMVSVTDGQRKRPRI